MRTGRLESKMGFPAGEVFPSPEQLAWHVSHLPCGRFSGLGAPTSHCRTFFPILRHRVLLGSHRAPFCALESGSLPWEKEAQQ